MKSLTFRGMLSSASLLRATTWPRTSEALLTAGEKVILCRLLSPEEFQNSSLTYLYSIVNPFESIDVIRALVGG